jgi:stage II sporulation protein D
MSKWRKAWKTLVAVTAYLYIPMLITLAFTGNGADVFIEVDDSAISGRRVNIIYDNATQTVGLDDFVAMVVAREVVSACAYTKASTSSVGTGAGGGSSTGIVADLAGSITVYAADSSASINFADNTETIRALSVLVRSDIVRQMGKREEIDSDRLENDFCTKSEMKKAWGDDWKSAFESLREIVSSTDGKILTYEGNAIRGLYTRVSSGKTLSGSKILGDEYKYLSEVECEKDEKAEDFSSVTEFDNSKILSLVSTWEKKNGTDTGLDSSNPSGDIQITAKTDEGYIVGVQVGDLCMSGEKFADMFGLKSAFFAFEYRDSGVKITTKGVGCGFGMSIYTANLMAADGSGFEEILKKFYPTCEIE